MTSILKEIDLTDLPEMTLYDFVQKALEESGTSGVSIAIVGQATDTLVLVCAHGKVAFGIHPTSLAVCQVAKDGVIDKRSEIDPTHVLVRLKSGSLAISPKSILTDEDETNQEHSFVMNPELTEDMLGVLSTAAMLYLGLEPPTIEEQDLADMADGIVAHRASSTIH